jgi:hypothetical protein
MDLIKDIVYEKRYTNDIKSNKYIQHSIKPNMDEKMTISKYLEELLLHIYDYKSVIQKNNKNYTDNRKIEFATLLDEESEKTYDNFNYDKRFSKKLLQRGLQENDTLSSILYISDLYNFGIVLYDKNNEKHYKLYSKIKPLIYVCYENNTFRIMEKPSELKHINYIDKLDGLTNILNLNIKDVYIYKKYLKPISNYKVDELVDIANMLNVNIMKNTKRMTKQDIYDAINSSKY